MATKNEGPSDELSLDERLVLLELLEHLKLDLKRDALLPVGDYVAFYPRHEELVRREFAAATNVPPVPRIYGVYKELSGLGSGGFGTVVLAEDTKLHRKVALKLLHSRHALSGEVVRKFEREASLAALASGDGACRVHAVGRANDVHFIAMEFIEGESLRTLLEKHRAERPGQAALRLHEAKSEHASIKAVLRFFEKIARVVHRVHQEGITHRDLKPGNIMVTPAGDPVILDFGLATLEDETRSRSGLVGIEGGTPAYMAPEQIAPDRGRVGASTDVWALGVVLFECLTGVRPFSAQKSSPLLQSILELEAPSAMELNPAVSRELDAVIERALTKQQDGRYGSAKKLADDLHAVLVGHPTSVRRASVLKRARRWIQRDRRRPAFIVVLVLVGLLGWAGFTALENRGLGKRSQQHATLGRQMLEALLGEVKALRGLSVSSAARRMKFDRVRAHVESYAGLGTDGESGALLADCWLGLSEAALDAGEFEEAFTTAKEGLSIREGIAVSSDASSMADVSIAAVMVGNALDRLGRQTETKTHYERAAAIDEHLAQAWPENRRVQDNLFWSYVRLFLLLRDGDGVTDAQMWLSKIEAQASFLEHRWPRHVLTRYALSEQHHHLSNYHDNVGHVEPAKAHAREALQLASGIVRETPTNPDFVTRLSTARLQVDQVDAYESTAPMEELEKALEDALFLVEADKQNLLFWIQLANAERSVAVESQRIDDAVTATAAMSRAVVAAERVFELRPKNFLGRTTLIDILCSACEHARAMGRTQDADALATRVIGLARGLAQGAAPAGAWRRVAGALLDSRLGPHRKPKEALTAAELAVELTDGKDLHSLSVLASCYRALNKIGLLSETLSRLIPLLPEGARRTALQDELSRLR